MKQHRFAALAAALCLTLSLVNGGRAAAVDQTAALETVRALGIMVGDSQGEMNLSAFVTRAEFVTMLTAASPYRDTVGSGYGVSLFKDVKSDHWAGEYVKLAVDQGWMTGYVDGTFRPERNITLEEACAALLNLLGYDSGSLAGAFPTAQLSKAGALGLLDGVAAARGETLTRRDCAALFYNLLVAQNSGGAVYGTTLGYTVTDGQVDYSTMVSADTKGPYVAASAGSLTLPFAAGDAAIYRNGALSQLSAVRQYDVYYYNTNLQTVWVYSDRVTGTLTGLSPSRTAPTSATVAGAAYPISTSTATYKLSSQGSYAPGDLVTVLLGMDGGIVDVVSAQESGTVYYGVVVSSAKAASTGAAATGSASVQVETQVACTDGVVRTFYHSGGALTTGRLVSAASTQSGTEVKSLPSSSLSGSVNGEGTKFAGCQFAENVEILDVDRYGGYVRIYPSRLAGSKLESEEVSYYSLDANGQIDRLILKEATGDTYSYAYITKVEKNSSELSTSASYQYIRNGENVSLTSNAIYSVTNGGAALFSEDGQLKSMRQLNSVELTQLSGLTAMAGNKSYQLDENVQVLLWDNTSGGRGCYATTLSEINASDYTLRGWYDDLGCSAGGRIRILVAQEKA